MLISRIKPRNVKEATRIYLFSCVNATLTRTSKRSIATTSVKCNNDQYSQKPPQQTIDQLKVFRDNASKWWNGKEFSILRSMNEIRVPFVVDGLEKPLNECKLLDVGCGGGILSEPLARLGANVLGIDPVFESINQAQIHAQTDPDLSDRLRYRNCNIDDLSPQSEFANSYDGVIASEVVEHVEDIENFLRHCHKVLKPNGSLFITTINQTPLSWLGVIFFGEYVLKQLPKGTHNYNMFVSVKGLRIMLERLGFQVKLINGFMYEPVGGKFYWTPTTLTHYALHAVKIIESPSSDGNRLPNKGVNFEQRRNAPKSKSSAKGKLTRPKSPLNSEDMMLVIPFDAYESKRNEILTQFKNHLQNNLTTRATTTTLETLKITLDGLNEPLDLRDIAQISMKGSNLIVINLSTMPEAVKPAVKAIMDLGNMSPQVEVNNIFVPIPRVTRERREGLVKTAKQAAGNSKEKLRALFSDFSSKAKVSKVKGSGVSEDLVHDVVENLHFDMSKNVLEIETLLAAKVKQLLDENY